MTNCSAIRSNLELFRLAHNWKAYYQKLIKNYLGASVLEVGAGIGSTTEILCQKNHVQWVCLEPDPLLSDQLELIILNNSLPYYCQLKRGTLLDLDKNASFDTILYIDVLEHIQFDVDEIHLACNHLHELGYLIIISPAYQWLFTPFDRALGHYRRYSKKTLLATIPQNLKCLHLMYIDSVGVIASLGNKLVLKKSIPSQKEIILWDKVMVPLSKIVDPLIRYSLGKSVIGIWRK